jgi:hypothetical protein
VKGEGRQILDAFLDAASGHPGPVILADLLHDGLVGNSRRFQLLLDRRPFLIGERLRALANAGEYGGHPPDSVEAPKLIVRDQVVPADLALHPRALIVLRLVDDLQAHLEIARVQPGHINTPRGLLVEELDVLLIGHALQTHLPAAVDQVLLARRRIPEHLERIAALLGDQAIRI